MPGAPHGLADHDAVGERRAVMGALCADREHFVALPDEEDRLAAHMPFKERAIAQTGERNALGKVRPSEALSVRSHPHLHSDPRNPLDAP